MTRNRAGTYIKYLVEGLAGNMRFAAASRAGRAIECCARKRTLLISRSDFAVNSTSVPVIAKTLPC
jgi:hypothetical protein